MSSVSVYGFRNIENGKMNIGVKSADGEDMLTYITSLNNDEFWEDYSKGLMQKSILFVGRAKDEDLARTIEWFALKYGISTKPEKFYLKKNNAHCVDEKLLTKQIKQTIIDYINGSPGIEVADSSAEDKSIVNSIDQNIKDRKYQVFDVETNSVHKFNRNQVRTDQYDPAHVSKIVTGMREQPDEARKVFGPVIVVIEEDGSKTILDGNNRTEAAKKMFKDKKGWSTVPVIYLNYTEFGTTESQRQNNYDLFGLLQNKRKFEVKKENSKEDLKRNINNFIVSKGLDLSKPTHVDRARKLIYDRFEMVCESRAQLNGVLVSILNDFEKERLELRYQKNLITYDDGFFSEYLWDKYEQHDVAAVSTSQSKAKFAEVLGWVFRRMQTVDAKKGAIVLYYASKAELVNDEQEKWIEKLRETIQFNNLPITVEVLPAFEN
jgi:hypothetical protein